MWELTFITSVVHAFKLITVTCQIAEANLLSALWKVLKEFCLKYILKNVSLKYGAEATTSLKKGVVGGPRKLFSKSL